MDIAGRVFLTLRFTEYSSVLEQKISRYVTAYSLHTVTLLVRHQFAKHAIATGTTFRRILCKLKIRWPVQITEYPGHTTIRRRPLVVILCDGNHFGWCWPGLCHTMWFGKHCGLHRIHDSLRTPYIGSILHYALLAVFFLYKILNTYLGTYL